MASKLVKYTIKRKNGADTHSSVSIGIGSVTNPTESLIYSKLKDYLKYTLKPGEELIITKIG